MNVTEYTSCLLPPTLSMVFSSSEGPLRKFSPAILSWSTAVCVLLSLVGCIAHAPGSSGGNSPTSVTISPTSATISGGATQNFTPTVTGPPVTAVQWYVNGIVNGNSTVGTITPSSTPPVATYNAPTTVPTPNPVSITAVAVADGTTSTPSLVTVTPTTVAVSVMPPTATVDAGTTANFTATVSGTSDFGVGWYVNCIPGGNPSVGTITTTSTSNNTTTAVYTVPAAAPFQTVQNTITAVWNPPGGGATCQSVLSGAATATTPPIAVTLSPSTGVSIPVSGTQQFTAAVTGTSNTAVTNWQVNGITGGNSTVGTIVSTGSDMAVYTAPANLASSPFPVTISAVSAADSFSLGQILANVHVTVTVTPATDTIGQSANLLYTATVNGANAANQGVDWSVTSPNGGGFVPTADTTGIPSNQGIYIAPPLAQGMTSLAATIVATAQFDQSQSGTATTTVELTDPLGKVTNFKAFTGTCPTGAEDTGNTSCYSMTVSCDGVADWTTYLKVNTPTLNPPNGTVIFSGDDGGANLYDTEYTYGNTTVGNVVDGGYTAVQVSFGAPFDNGANPNGWLTGPGGVRRLACRYAAVADWIYNNPQMINSNSKASGSAPMCATGNGGGAGAIGYAVSEYGMNGLNAASGVNSNFAMVELTSGPLYTALDQGCICSTNLNGPSGSPCSAAPAPMCYTAGTTTIDAAYSQPNVCSSGNTSNTLLLTSDSIYYQRGKGGVFPVPNTTVDMQFGGKDSLSDASEPQGWQWNRVLLQVKTQDKQVCQSGATHDLPNDSGSATAIATDITTDCK